MSYVACVDTALGKLQVKVVTSPSWTRFSPANKVTAGLMEISGRDTWPPGDMVYKDVRVVHELSKIGLIWDKSESF